MIDRERAEELGYVHCYCKKHGGFWTDSGDGCPSCPQRVDDEESTDLDKNA